MSAERVAASSRVRSEVTGGSRPFCGILAKPTKQILLRPASRPTLPASRRPPIPAVAYGASSRCHTNRKSTSRDKTRPPPRLVWKQAPTPPGYPPPLGKPAHPHQADPAHAHFPPHPPPPPPPAHPSRRLWSVESLPHQTQEQP